MKNKLLNHCGKLWHACVTWDGMVVPCCFDKVLPIDWEIYLNSFTEIWKGMAYKQFRQQLLQGRDQIEICTNRTRMQSIPEKAESGRVEGREM